MVLPPTRFSRFDDLPWRDNRDQNPNDQGKAKTVISRELNGSEDLMIGVGWLEPGQVHILHHHPNASEFYYVISGSATITVAGQIVAARPGTAVYIPPPESHKIVNDGEETCVILFGYNQPQHETVWDA